MVAELVARRRAAKNPVPVSDTRFTPVKTLVAKLPSYVAEDSLGHRGKAPERAERLASKDTRHERAPR